MRRTADPVRRFMLAALTVVYDGVYDRLVPDFSGRVALGSWKGVCRQPDELEVAGGRLIVRCAGLRGAGFPRWIVARRAAADDVVLAGRRRRDERARAPAPGDRGR